METSSTGLGALWALAGVVVTALFAWLTQRSKGRVEESVSVRGEWEKLTTSLSSRLTAVEKEFSEYRQAMSKEFDDLRKSHRNEMDEMRDRHRDEMKAMRLLNEGLQRMIAQNSKSSAYFLAENPAKGSLHAAFDTDDQPNASKP